MSKRTHKVKVNKNRLLGTKLGAKVLVAVFCSLCISLLVFLNLYMISNWTVEKYSSTTYAQVKLSEFQDYVDKKRIHSDDFSALTAWINKNDIKFMHIYRGAEMVFNSYDPINDTYTYDESERDYYWSNRAITFIEKVEYVEKVVRGETGEEQAALGAEAATDVTAAAAPTDSVSESAVQGAQGATDTSDATGVTETSPDGIPYPVPGPEDSTGGKVEEYLAFDERYDEHITYEALNVFIAVGNDMRLLIILLIVSVILSLIVFSLLVLKFISSRVMYLVELSGDVAQIEGGMIERSITVKGNDEIAYLAQGVEDMRTSLVERLQSEKEAYDANRELITAMSHDLRTPLSALIGYLEIIGGGVYSDEEQKNTYIKKSVEKAYQLKAMSDKLFDYFTVFKNEGTDELNLEVYDGYDLLSQMIAEQSYMLDEKGYEIVFEGLDPARDAPAYSLQLDSSALLRVFDNIYSNILKYADKREPVRIRLESDGNNVRVSVTNRINRTAVKVASTRIGLKSCRRLMARMNGTLKTSADANYYTVTIVMKKYIPPEEE